MLYLKIALRPYLYQHQYPVAAGLVAEPQHYIYSSALDYAGGKGLIDDTLL
jgi:hypothetical protein